MNHQGIRPSGWILSMSAIEVGASVSAWRPERLQVVDHVGDDVRAERGDRRVAIVADRVDAVVVVAVLAVDQAAVALRRRRRCGVGEADLARRGRCDEEIVAQRVIPARLGVVVADEVDRAVSRLAVEVPQAVEHRRVFVALEGVPEGGDPVGPRVSSVSWSRSKKSPGDDQIGRVAGRRSGSSRRAANSSCAKKSRFPSSVARCRSLRKINLRSISCCDPSTANVVATGHPSRDARRPRTATQERGNCTKRPNDARISA